mmetsp:Transcript_40292/g.101373  ORF Transcript_40292/g.101373 Transcript_40292/m.101373 type:complete len:104 (-) Transcript_40292:1060-1371(-)
MPTSLVQVQLITAPSSAALLSGNWCALPACQGHGLEGIRYDDVEEVWVEDEDGNGEWQRVTSKTSAMPAPREVFKKLPPTGRRSSKKATSNLLLAGDDIMEEI